MAIYLDDLHDALDMRDDAYEELKFIVKQEKFVVSIIGKFIFGCVTFTTLFAIFQAIFSDEFTEPLPLPINSTLETLLNIVPRIFIISISLLCLYGGYRLFAEMSLPYDKILKRKFKWRTGYITDKRQSFVRRQYKDETKHDRYQTTTYTEKTLFVDDDPCNIINPFDYSRSKIGDKVVILYLGRYNYAIRLKAYLE